MKLLQILSLAFLFCLATPFSSLAQGAEKATESMEVSKSQTITVKVKGIGCSRDVKAIATNVETLAGVAQCKVGKKGATTSYKVTFDPTLVTRTQIEATVEGTPGYKNPND